MSTNRTNPQAGWADLDELPKGEHGRRLCRRCGIEVPKGRRTFCCEPCVHEWKIRTNPGYARRQVEKRDQGVCAACGFDTKTLDRKTGGTFEEREAQQKALGFPPWGHRWEADHIVPVAEGGGECGLENLRTLCIPCHKQATNELRRRLAHHRAQAQNQGDLDMTAKASDVIGDEPNEPIEEPNPPEPETMPAESEPRPDPAELDVTIDAQLDDPGADDPADFSEVDDQDDDDDEDDQEDEDLDPNVDTPPSLGVEDDPDLEEYERDKFMERDLTTEEKLKIGIEMADALQEAAELEEQKRAYDSRMKEKIEAQYEEATTLANALHRGKREGNVRIRVRKDWHTGTIRTIRLDTGEQIEERAMTFDERQRGMFTGKIPTENQIPAAPAPADGFQNTPRIVEPAPAAPAGEHQEVAPSGAGPEPAPGHGHEPDPADALAQTAAEQVGNA